MVSCHANLGMAGGAAMKLIPCSFQTPNAYVDLFMPYLESYEWRVLSYAIRHIFGWDDRIEDRRRRMSISTFEHGVPSFPGCGLSRPAIVRVLGNLSKYGLMKKIGKPTSQGQLFELPVDSAEIDLEGLKQRLEEKKAKSTKRTQKARKTKKERANQPEAVSPTYPLKSSFQIQLLKSIHQIHHQMPKAMMIFHLR